MVGDTYSIVDMSVWGWGRAIPFIFGPKAWSQYPNVKRLLDEISARPAAERAAALTTKHSFKQEMDEEARHKRRSGLNRKPGFLHQPGKVRGQPYSRGPHGEWSRAKRSWVALLGRLRAFAD
jgi:hypothetical protein